VAAKVSAMFEDLPHNLESPHALGMSTVLVRSTYIDHPAQRAMTEWRALPAHIHHVTDNLTGFLQQVLAETAPKSVASPE
jgi:putative hydrolase of the HAD superfamily